MLLVREREQHRVLDPVDSAEPSIRKPLRPERVVEDAGNTRCWMAGPQVDQHVAADDQVELRERRVRRDVLAREDAMSRTVVAARDISCHSVAARTKSLKMSDRACLNLARFRKARQDEWPLRETTS